jgi:hypothetical protein
MKRLTLSLMAIFMVALLTLPAFAVNQTGDIVQNPMLIDTAGIAAYPTGNQSLDRSNIERDLVINPMLIDTAGVAAYPTRNQSLDEHYGIAPAWENREGNSGGIVLGKYRAWDLPGLKDNTGE